MHTNKKFAKSVVSRFVRVFAYVASINTQLPRNFDHSYFFQFGLAKGEKNTTISRTTSFTFASIGVILLKQVKTKVFAGKKQNSQRFFLYVFLVDLEKYTCTRITTFIFSTGKYCRKNEKRIMNGSK